MVSQYFDVNSLSRSNAICLGILVQIKTSHSISSASFCAVIFCTGLSIVYFVSLHTVTTASVYVILVIGSFDGGSP